MSLPPHKKGPSEETPLPPKVSAEFRASFHIQSAAPYDYLRTERYSSCMVCGRSVDAIKRERVDWYMERSTPRDKPESIIKLRREAYLNGLNAGSFFSWHPQCCRLPPVTKREQQRHQLGNKSHPEFCSSSGVNLTQQSDKLKIFTLISKLFILDFATFIDFCWI